MPTAPPRICNRCHQPTPARGPCQCRPAWEGSTRPGSNRRWRQLRTAKLAANPICEHPGCRRPAHTIDHITPLAEGGSNEWANLQSLCAAHNTEKTTADALRGKNRAR